MKKQYVIPNETKVTVAELIDNVQNDDWRQTRV